MNPLHTIEPLLFGNPKNPPGSSTSEKFLYYVHDKNRGKILVWLLNFYGGHETVPDLIYDDKAQL